MMAQKAKLFNDKINYEKILELTNSCKNVECFEFEGQLFKGYIPEVVKQYVKENPSKSFWVWLKDKKLDLYQTN